MASSKSNKEKKPSKTSPAENEGSPKKPASKSKKQLDDEEEADEDIDSTKTSKKSAKGSSKKSSTNEEEDDDDAEEIEDEWEKVEEDENWDPDFDEFDLPKSKTKKASPGTGIPKKKGKVADDDDLGLDEDFKEMDLFNDSGFDDDEDDF